MTNAEEQMHARAVSGFVIRASFVIPSFRHSSFITSPFMNTLTRIAVFILISASFARAEINPPAIIGNHMVLQQKQSNPIWGWDAPGTKVTVSFGGQTKTAEAGPDGKWTVKLDPVPASAEPRTLTIAGSETKEIQ